MAARPVLLSAIAAMVLSGTIATALAQDTPPPPPPPTPTPGGCERTPDPIA